MAEGYKIRLADGSEIGPMNLQAVRDWHRQGFLQPSSPVLRPGTTRWTTLDQVLEPQAFSKAGGSSTSRRAPAAAPAIRPDRPETPARQASSRRRTPGPLPWRRLLRGALGLAVLGAGAYAYLRFFGETPLERQVREAATADASYADESLGVRLELPRGWRILQKGSSLVAAPPDARVTLAQGRTATFAFLTVETSPPKVTSLDDYLDRVLSQRKPAESSPFEESGRTDVSVGGLPGRRAAGAWGKGDDRHQEHTVVWKDGWVYFALTAWAPEASTAAPRALDALVAGFRTNGALDDRVRSAVQMVTREVPILSASGAETLMSRSAARVLEPDQAFRRSIEALCRALVRWKAAEVRELGRLTTAAYAQLPGKDRSRLARYFEKVRANESTSSQEDREASLIMKKAVLHLSAAQQQRFREVCERAIRDSAGTY